MSPTTNSIKRMFFKSTLVLIFFVSHSIHAQNYLWAKRAGGSDLDEGKGIATDASGNVITTGYFASPLIAFGNTNLVNSSTGIYDAYLVKYDSNGNLLWAKKIGDTGSDTGRSVCVDTLGNIIIAGAFSSATLTIGNTVLTNNGWDDAFIAKFNPNGNLIWAKSFGGINVDYSNSVSTDSNGNIIFCGSYSSPTCSFDGTVLNNQGSFDIFLTKLNPSGTILWTKNIGGSFFEVDATVKYLSNGAVVLSGSFASQSLVLENTTLNSVGETDIFLAKFSSNGNVIWAKSFGGSDHDFNSQISIDNNDNIYQTGDFTSLTMNIGTNSINNSGEYDAYICKFDTNGNELWSKSYGGPGFDYGNTITIDNNENIFTAFSYFSSSLSADNLSFTNNGIGDILLMKLNTDGTIIWAQSIGGTDTETSTNIVTDPQGNLILSGYFSSQPFPVGSINLNNAGSNDIFIIKIDASSLTEIEDNASVEFQLYPNPSSEAINIHINANSIGKDYKILDAVGKVILSGKLHSENTSIDLADLQSGAYTIVLGEFVKRKFQKY
jgi:hypothetical protein